MTLAPSALLAFTAAAVLLACWRPRWALLLPLVFHASHRLRSSFQVGDFAFPTSLLEILVIVAVVSGIRLSGSAVLRAVRQLPRSVSGMIMLFLLAATMSAAIAPHSRTAWGSWKAFIIEPVLYAVVLIPTVRTAIGQQSVIRALVLGGVVSASTSLIAGVTTNDFHRLAGVYDVPNSLALVLAPLLALAAAVHKMETGRRLRSLALLTSLVGVPALLLTQSLGGLLAAASGAISARWRSRRFVLAVGLLVFLALAFQIGTGKLAHAVAPNAPLHARLQIWSVSLALIRDHPILGIGLGTFEPAYQQKLHELLAVGGGSWSVREWVVRDPHHVVLSFWLHTGFLGLAAMTVLCGYAFRGWTPHDDFGNAARAALVTLLLFGLVDVPYLKNDLALLWWVYLLGAVMASTFRHREEM